MNDPWFWLVLLALSALLGYLLLLWMPHLNSP